MRVGEQRGEQGICALDRDDAVDVLALVRQHHGVLADVDLVIPLGKHDRHALMPLATVHDAQHGVGSNAVGLGPRQPQALHDGGRVDESAVHIEQDGAGADGLGHPLRLLCSI